MPSYARQSRLKSLILMLPSLQHSFEWGNI